MTSLQSQNVDLQERLNQALAQLKVGEASKRSVFTSTVFCLLRRWLAAFSDGLLFVVVDGNWRYVSRPCRFLRRALDCVERLERQPCVEVLHGPWWLLFALAIWFRGCVENVSADCSCWLDAEA